MLRTRAPLSPHPLSPTRQRVLSPAFEHVPKRHELSVGDKELSSAPAPEQVPELQLFANLKGRPVVFWGARCAAWFHEKPLGSTIESWNWPEGAPVYGTGPTEDPPARQDKHGIQQEKFEEATLRRIHGD
jgi:hypothetical protein